jgi:hypothetical protein
MAIEIAAIQDPEAVAVRTCRIEEASTRKYLVAIRIADIQVLEAAAVCKLPRPAAFGSQVR